MGSILVRKMRGVSSPRTPIACASRVMDKRSPLFEMGSAYRRRSGAALSREDGRDSMAGPIFRAYDWCFLRGACFV